MAPTTRAQQQALQQQAHAAEVVAAAAAQGQAAQAAQAVQAAQTTAQLHISSLQHIFAQLGDADLAAASAACSAWRSGSAEARQSRRTEKQLSDALERQDLG